MRRKLRIKRYILSFISLRYYKGERKMNQSMTKMIMMIYKAKNIGNGLSVKNADKPLPIKSGDKK